MTDQEYKYKIRLIQRIEDELEPFKNDPTKADLIEKFRKHLHQLFGIVDEAIELDRIGKGLEITHFFNDEILMRKEDSARYRLLSDKNAGFKIVIPSDFKFT